MENDDAKKKGREETETRKIKAIEKRRGKIKILKKIKLREKRNTLELEREREKSERKSITTIFFFPYTIFGFFETILLTDKL